MHSFAIFIIGYINEFGFLNLRRFGRLIYYLEPKDFELYRNCNKNVVSSMAEKMSALKLNNNNNNNNADGTEPSAMPELGYSDFLEMKDQYYTQALGNREMPDYPKMSASYAKMIQWTLFYYYNTTYSWGHHYPYDCVPFVSDLKDVHKVTMNLEIDKPASVFTHLLAILPTKSATLLPKCYRSEMSDEPKIPVC